MRNKILFCIAVCLIVTFGFGRLDVAYGGITGVYSIWDPNRATIPATPFLGNDPNQTIADADGLTSHVATPVDPLTIATVYENTICSGAPCGVTYWNPVTNLFRCYGYSAGSMNGIDINTSAPVITNPAFPVKSFGPGDTWLFKSSGRALTVHFPGSDSFRSWNPGSIQGGQVDQATGKIWYAQTSGSLMGLHDPATDVSRRWALGGTPHYITLDSTGRSYTTVGGLQQIVRIDPVSNEVKRWAVPGGGLETGTSFENPNGITTDADGIIWFAESASDEIASLNPATDTICEYTKAGVNRPRNVSASGTRAAGDLQVFFTEQGSGGAFGFSGSDPGSVSILTAAEAEGHSQLTPPFEICTLVTPTTETITPVSTTLAREDHTHTPTVKTIIPEVFTVPGVDGVPNEKGTMTPDGDLIPPILRFPILPLIPISGDPLFAATGMTQVALANSVFGSLVGSDHHFQLNSGAVIAPPIGECDDDGIPDDEDNCPCINNVDQEDADLDGLGDVCDNCPDVVNLDQADTDMDGIGDVCDACPLDADNDLDGDSVCGDVDICADTLLPESVPLVELGTNRFANTDLDPEFETTAPKGGGKGPRKSFTMDDTQGCSCEQIIEALDLGKGHTKFGCSISAMEDFIALIELEEIQQNEEALEELAILALECVSSE